MANIQKLTYPYFTDGTTALDATNLNPIIAKLNEVIDKINGGVTPTQTVATPTISISGATATITCSTSGATIYYTTNGNTPTTNSTQYTGAITLSGACTIKAIAVKSGMNNSSVASQPYTPSGSVEAPTITLTLAGCTMSAESGATIYYTTNGNTPTTSSTQYSGEVTFDESCVIKAIAVKNGVSSNVAVKNVEAMEWSDIKTYTDKLFSKDIPAGTVITDKVYDPYVMSAYFLKSDHSSFIEPVISSISVPYTAPEIISGLKVNYTGKVKIGY